MSPYHPIYCDEVEISVSVVCICVCVCVGERARDDPWGEQIDGIMHVLNIITMQNLDGILGGIQALMGFGNSSSAWDWTHTSTQSVRARTHTHTPQPHTFYEKLTGINDLD